MAIPFVRIYLHAEMSLVHDAFHPEVRFSIYVDDAGQLCVGPIRFVMHWLARAAMAFVRAAKRLFLPISTKTTIVASSPDIVTYVVKHLSHVGLKVDVAPYARDLGLLFTVARSRRVHLLNSK